MAQATITSEEVFTTLINEVDSDFDTDRTFPGDKSFYVGGRYKGVIRWNILVKEENGVIHAFVSYPGNSDHYGFQFAMFKDEATVEQVQRWAEYYREMARLFI